MERWIFPSPMKMVNETGKISRLLYKKNLQKQEKQMESTAPEVYTALLAQFFCILFFAFLLQMGDLKCIIEMRYFLIEGKGL